MTVFKHSQLDGYRFETYGNRMETAKLADYKYKNSYLAR